MRYEPVAINIHLWETRFRYLMVRSASSRVSSHLATCLRPSFETHRFAMLSSG
jgi:hypothetical protein